MSVPFFVKIEKSKFSFRVKHQNEAAGGSCRGRMPRLILFCFAGVLQWGNVVILLVTIGLASCYKRKVQLVFQQFEGERGCVIRWRGISEDPARIFSCGFRKRMYEVATVGLFYTLRLWRGRVQGRTLYLSTSPFFSEYKRKRTKRPLMQFLSQSWNSFLGGCGVVCT
jgi:hypothetical protein